jgi:dihydrofolate synthase/folylpolyglutamate synthase
MSPQPGAPQDAAAALARAEKELLARWPESRIEWKPERVAKLIHALGDPHLAYPSIHIAGTNGKTSTSRMAEALVHALGLRTGRYTSPHLESITERISIDMEPLTPQAFADVYDEVAPVLDLVDAQLDVRLSFFEAITGIAFAAFAETPVDVAVIEVGMGGRLDATNVVPAPVAVITPIDLDHMAYLGDTIEQIAAEKAGIIKPDQVVIIANQRRDALDVLLRKAADVGATVALEGSQFGIAARETAVGGQLLTLRGLHGVYDDVYLPLHGAYQASNAACALAAVESLLAQQHALDADAVRAAFAGVRSPGRLETVRTSPTILVDATHNPAGARATVEALDEAFAFRRLVGVIAPLADKDVRGMLETFEPFLAHVVVTQNASPRAMPVDELAALAVEVFGAERVDVAAHLDEAIDVAVERAEEDAEFGGVGVLVTGSVVTAGEARTLLRRP